MGGASSYLAILAVCGFLSAAWTATKLSQIFGVSSVVLEIATGMILGPRVFGLISEEYAICSTLTHTACVPGPDFLQNMDRGLPVGSDLARFVHGDHCRRSDYRHVRVAQRADVSSATDDEGDDEAVVPIDRRHSPDTHADAVGHMADHPQPAASVNAGHHRRLYATGRKYNSYEECIQKSCESEVSNECSLAPDWFTLIGHAGVALMIFESGMHFDFEKARVVGPQACLVAVFGIFLPLISGTLLMVAYGKPLVPDSVSVGTALAPTSAGIALRLLGEAGVLRLDFGQTIITAAFVDDILSLVLFNALFSLSGGFSVMAAVGSPIVGVVFMGIAMVMAMRFWPKVFHELITPRLPVRLGEPKVTVEDEALFLLMMSLLVLYATITHFLGTHLWGCFIAGMSFACIDSAKQKGHTHHVWVRQTKLITAWMIRIFFACTVAFSIPIKNLLSFEAFWKGTIMGIGPCVLSKVFCAPFMGRTKFVIGWAMVGRAEFAYLIAQTAATAGMIDADTFSIAIWALLYATIAAPIVLRAVLHRYIADEGLEDLWDPTYANSELEEEEEEDLLDDRSEYAEVATRKPAFGAGPSMYANALADLDDVALDPTGLQKEELVADKVAVNGEAADVPTAPWQERLRRKLWYGRQPTQEADTSTGFLCCLFKNVV